jgi:hypothetical protein
MKTIRQSLVAILLVALSLSFSGCLGMGAKVAPAQVAASGLSTLAVLPFEGDYGEQVRADLYGRLSAIEGIRLVDISLKDQLEKAVFDQIDDPRIMPELSNLQADAVVVGRMSGVDLQDSAGNDAVEKTVGTGQYKKNFLGMNVEITKKEIQQVPYVVRKASMSCAVKLVNLKTREILAVANVIKDSDEKYGGDKEDALVFGRKLSELPTRVQVFNKLSSQVAAELADRIEDALDAYWTKEKGKPQ